MRQFRDPPSPVDAFSEQPRVVCANGYRTHIPSEPVRLQTAPTGLGTPKLTLIVRFLTAPNTKKNEINQVNLV